MKKNTLKLLPLTLTTALMLTACSAAHAASASYTTSLSESAAGTSSSQSSGITGAASQEEIYDAAFSKRDLSGEYDASEAVSIKLDGNSASCSSGGVSIKDSAVTISEAGTYLLSGKYSGSIIVDATSDDKVQLILDNVTVASDTFAAIYVRQADKVFVTLADGTVNELTNGGSFTQIDDNEIDAVIFAKDDITLNGTGTLKISSPAGHGISGKDEVTITDGIYEISAANHAIRAKDSLAIAGGTFTLTADKDGLHAENGDDDTLGNIYIAGGQFAIEVDDDAIHANTLLQIDDGTFEITAAEGLEATYIRINGGKISISASDDGVNAAYKSTAYTPTFEMNNGTLTIVMGAGDTDGVDSNGNIIINGGTIDVTGQSTFDYDGSAQYNGGTLIVNGEVVNSIPNQQMGGGHGGTGMDGHGMRGSETDENAMTPPSMDGSVPGGPGMKQGGMGRPGMNSDGSGRSGKGKQRTQ